MAVLAGLFSLRKMPGDSPGAADVPFAVARAVRAGGLFRRFVKPCLVGKREDGSGEVDAFPSGPRPNQCRLRRGHAQHIV
jgi:hypothetical protein